jgi:hypothetical protein
MQERSLKSSGKDDEASRYAPSSIAQMLSRVTLCHEALWKETSFDAKERSVSTFP